MPDTIEDKYTQTSFVNIVGLSWTFVQKNTREFVMMGLWHWLIWIFNYIAIILSAILFAFALIPIIVLTAVFKIDPTKLLLWPGIIGLGFGLIIIFTGVAIAMSTIEATKFQKIAYNRNTDGIIGSYFSNFSSFCYRLLGPFTLSLSLIVLSSLSQNQFVTWGVSILAYLWLGNKVVRNLLRYQFLPYAKSSGKFTLKQDLFQHIETIPLACAFNLVLQATVITGLTNQLPAILIGVTTGPLAFASLFNSKFALITAIPTVLMAIVITPAASAFAGIMKAIYYDIQTRHNFNPPGKVKPQARSLFITMLIIVIVVFTMSIFNALTNPQFKEAMNKASTAQQTAEQMARKQMTDKGDIDASN
jgi:hypothetical protein